MSEHKVLGSVSLRHRTKIRHCSGGSGSSPGGGVLAPLSGDSAGWVVVVFRMTSAPLASFSNSSDADVLRGGSRTSLEESLPIATLPAGVSTRKAAEPGMWVVQIALTFTSSVDLYQYDLKASASIMS